MVRDEMLIHIGSVQEDEGILEAYVKSWVSGSLDKAATRDSMTYAIVVHHLSSFIFNNICGEKLLLRNKLVKSLLRDYSRKQQHEVCFCFMFCCFKSFNETNRWHDL